jgi:hypothetical protein
MSIGNPEVYTLSESDHITRAQQGSFEAYVFLHQQFVDIVFRFIYAHTFHKVKSFDLTEEVFIQTWLELQSSSRKFESLLAILLKKAIALLREEKVSSNTLYHPSPLELQVLNNKQSFHAVLNALPHMEHQFLILKYICELDDKLLSLFFTQFTQEIEKRSLERLSSSLASRNHILADRPMAWLLQAKRTFTLPSNHRERAGRRLFALLSSMAWTHRIRAVQVSYHQDAAQKPRWGVRFRFAPWSLTILLVLITLLLGSTTVVYAAQNSLPGDILYDTKLVLENVRLKIEGNDPESIFMLHAEFAMERIEEIALKTSNGNYENIDLAIKNLETQLLLIDEILTTSEINKKELITLFLSLRNEITLLSDTQFTNPENKELLHVIVLSKIILNKFTGYTILDSNSESLTDQLPVIKAAGRSSSTSDDLDDLNENPTEGDQNVPLSLKDKKLKDTKKSAELSGEDENDQIDKDEDEKDKDEDEKDKDEKDKDEDEKDKDEKDKDEKDKDEDEKDKRQDEGKENKIK